MTNVIGVSSLALLVSFTVGCAPQGDEARTSPSPSSSVATPSESVASSAPMPTPTEPPPPLPTPSPDELVVFVTYGAEAGSVYASGIVPDRVDESGTCTLTAKSGSETRSAELEAGPSPTTMNCGEIRIAVPAGEWSLTITYTSGNYSGFSGEVTVTVP